jgi:hypothetical protein
MLFSKQGHLHRRDIITNGREPESAVPAKVKARTHGVSSRSLGLLAQLQSVVAGNTW